MPEKNAPARCSRAVDSFLRPVPEPAQLLRAPAAVWGGRCMRRRDRTSQLLSQINPSAQATVNGFCGRVAAVRHPAAYLQNHHQQPCCRGAGHVYPKQCTGNHIAVSWATSDAGAIPSQAACLWSVPGSRRMDGKRATAHGHRTVLRAKSWVP